jgi:hypothetical protein
MNDYINIILKSKKVKNYLKKICTRNDIIDDLFQFCILCLLEKDINSLNLILKNSNKNIEDYFIGIIVLQYKSNTSQFYKEYINCGFNKSISIKEINEDINNYHNIDEEKIDDSVRDSLIQKIDKAIISADPFKIDLFKLKYYEDWTYREISIYYNISMDSVINKIKSVKKYIKNTLNKNIEYSELRRKDHEIRRIKQGKIIITNDIKKQIYNEFIIGNTKISLSKKYQLSYPIIIKIIKEYDNNIND